MRLCSLACAYLLHTGRRHGDSRERSQDRRELTDLTRKPPRDKSFVDVLTLLRAGRRHGDSRERSQDRRELTDLTRKS